MKKILLFFFFLYLLKKIHTRKQTQKQTQTQIQSKLKKPLDVDVILAPGGYKGIYMIGICHYIKNHFNLSNKKIAGFSCGSFNSLFMRLKPELDHTLLKLMFALRTDIPMSQLLTDTIDLLNNHFTTEDFDFKDIRVGVSTTSGLVYFQDFIDLKDATECCKSSSFIPFITYNDLFLVYKNRLTLDGGLFYKNIKKYRKKETLLVSSSMFGRYADSLISGIKKPTTSYYHLYLNGYRDAQKNHAMLSNYFQGSGS